MSGGSHLVWPAGHNLSSHGGQTGGFPMLQLNEAQVRSGAVKVVARSPSGQTRALNIQIDANGQYNTNFTPNEVGDWLINIQYEGHDIQGSPFSVRVHDPNRVRVHGLHDCSHSGKEITFTVDTSEAGIGDVEAEVIYMGRSVKARAIRQQGQQFQFGFIPEGSGRYDVHVYFARSPVPGSPFNVDVVNPSVVVASGEGLTNGKVDHKSSFIVNTGGQSACNRDLIVCITAPDNSKLPATVIENGAGVFAVEFEPKQVGNHRIEVLFHDVAVHGSPFTCHVYDVSQIIVNNLSGSTVVGKIVDFSIDANEAGNGKLEIVINDGQVPCRVEVVGNRQYAASFIPIEAVPHVVRMYFNGQEILGSPWIVDVLSADNVRTSVGNLQCIPVNRAACFDVCTVNDGNVEVKVTAPHCKVLVATVTRKGLGLYAVEFLPTEIGAHSIAVSYEGLAVCGTPHVCHVFDSSAVTVSPIAGVAAGELVEFTVDACSAGKGELAIVVNEGSIPAEARLVGPNLYAVSFTPLHPGFYSVDLSFNGIPLKDSPVMVAVVDASLVKLNAGNSPFVPVREVAVVNAVTKAAGPAKLTAKVTSPSCKDNAVSVNGTDDAGFNIEFTPTEPGHYSVDVRYGGQCLPCGPLVLVAYDVSRIRVMGVRDGITNVPSTFIVDLNKCGEGELDVTVLTANGLPVINEVAAVEPGRLEVKYVPVDSGIHFAELTFNGATVPGSPFQFNVVDSTKVTTRGDGLTVVECNKLATFMIMAPEIVQDAIDVLITGPSGRQILPFVKETKPFTYMAEYTPTTAGIYRVDIRSHGVDIPGSPFTVRCWDASRLLIANINQCQVGHESYFNVEMCDAGDGTVEVSISGPNGQLIPNTIVTSSIGLLEVHFIPSVSGIHRASVTYNGVAVPGSPAQFSVVDASKVVVRGDGLGLVQCGRKAMFVVNAPDAKLSDMDISLIGPNNQHLIPDVTETSKGNYRVEYTPTLVGQYEIHVVCFGMEVRSSPFIAKAWDARHVLLADVSMGQVGVESKFKVIVTEAGEGVLTITLVDPSGHLVSNQAIPVEPGVLDVVFTPKIPGIHRGNVVFNKEVVPGSPFTMQVVDINSVTCWGDGLTSVPVKKLASFTITAQQAQMKDIAVRIIGAAKTPAVGIFPWDTVELSAAVTAHADATSWESMPGPQGNDVMSRVTEAGNSSFRVDYTPLNVGVYLVSVSYYGKPIPSCPLTAHAWDISKVLVSPIELAFVGRPAQFNVETREAGEGKLDVVLTGERAQRVICDVTTDKHGVSRVSFVPQSAGLHRADVTFNGESVAGNPFTFTVADPANVLVTGEGIDLVRCGRATSFKISSPAAKNSDLYVKITGPNGKHVHHRTLDTGAGLFTVEYTPQTAGKHDIVIKYFDQAIHGSPFTANAWDPAGVTVSNIRPGVVGKPYSFNVNASEAGVGNLEISVQCRGETVPNIALPIPQTGTVEVTFTPIYVQQHNIQIRFNGELIPGNPFVIPIIDGNLVTANGPGLDHVIAHSPTTFNVATNLAGGEAELAVSITSSCGRFVEQVAIEGRAATGFMVTYVPIEPGSHTAIVKYADMPIKGSPFTIDVYDPSAVRIVGLISPVERIGRPVSVKVDATLAGRGTVTAQVKGHTSQPGVTISGATQGITSLSFVPVETGEHTLFIYFNDVNIPGSPFRCNVIDPRSIHVNWDALHLRPVNQAIEILLNCQTAICNADLQCLVTDPFGRPVVVAQNSNEHIHGFMFVGQDVGPHIIDLLYGTEPVGGSPYTCFVYDAQSVRIVDLTPVADIGDDISFTVDTSQAGRGDVDVTVTQGTLGIPVRRQQIGTDQVRFCFNVTQAKDPFINVTFNSEKIPGSPATVHINNPACKMLLSNGNATRSVAVNQPIWAVVSPPGYPIFPQDLLATVFAPSGELLPVKVTPQADGGIRLEYQSSFIGPHGMEVSYAGQAIPGSPIVTELFDPSKITIEGNRQSRVGEAVFLDINRALAGQAELVITITDREGLPVPFEVVRTDVGETVKYVPQSSGTLVVNLTFGGVTVPGCPVYQEVVDVPFATASGKGLEQAIVDRAAEFVVDVNRERGELLAEVQGPNSIALCHVEPENNGILKVKYVPTEVGIYTVLLQWNGVPVQGTPFHPKVYDPSQVEIMSCNANWTDFDRLRVQIGELTTLVFDCKYAGPGKLTASVEGPDGDIGADVIQSNDDEYSVKFVPRKEVDYFIRVHFCDQPIRVFPIIATALRDIRPPPPLPPPCIPVPEPIPSRPDLISVHGPGLSTAYVMDPADFLVDAHEGGPGMLDIQLVGLKCNIEVACVPVGENVFGCTYVPEIAGAYLLSVLWSGHHVPGSPFKVSVLSRSDASKVLVAGEGLTSGMVGRESAVLIDCRRAGCGEIEAQCSGTGTMAYCLLLDRHDGTFELKITPQEPGPHILEIKYGGEPIPRSPFNIKVAAVPDAGRVRVTGSGIQDGILAAYQSCFSVDTRGAGPGQLTVKVRGPKGAFHVEMQRQPDSERVILCRYHPTEVGEYQVYVMWSGLHVPGSPFRVRIVDTLQQLREMNGGYLVPTHHDSKFGLADDGLLFRDV